MKVGSLELVQRYKAIINKILLGLLKVGNKKLEIATFIIALRKNIGSYINYREPSFMIESL